MLRRTWMAVVWRPLTRDGHPSSLNSERVVTREMSLERSQSREVSQEVSLADIERDTSATLSVGRPVVYWLVEEPTVVLRGSSAGVLRTHGVLQCLPGRLDCVPDRAKREIVSWRWTRVLCCFQGITSHEACVGSAICLRSSADGGGRFECRQTFFCCTELS